MTLPSTAPQTTTALPVRAVTDQFPSKAATPGPAHTKGCATKVNPQLLQRNRRRTEIGHS